MQGLEKNPWNPLICVIRDSDKKRSISHSETIIIMKHYVFIDILNIFPWQLYLKENKIAEIEEQREND